MKDSKILTTEDYVSSLPESRKTAINKLRDVLNNNLPKGFEEQLSYGMIGYVVPHSIYPNGYHCNPKLPLPFINIGSQKNFIAVYHMGLYANKNLLNWFLDAYPKYSSYKLDMGKSCIRFKKIDAIPYELIKQLAKKLSPKQWISQYEASIKK